MIAPYDDKGWSLKAPPLQGRGLGWGLSVEQLRTKGPRTPEGEGLNIGTSLERSFG
jgi:hypothetical protein